MNRRSKIPVTAKERSDTIGYHQVETRQKGVVKADTGFETGLWRCLRRDIRVRLKRQMASEQEPIEQRV
ncbi:hypothetical protein LP421_24900 [Rhizobium sp. RCAM05350]|nr:hypothetical protein LP421_24900 [Rhizobium sp. RCAM05350]